VLVSRVPAAVELARDREGCAVRVNVAPLRPLREHADAVLLEFLQSTYDVAAETGNWDRARWSAAGDGRTDGVAQDADRRSESRGNEVDH
jgi:hypothetical protein